MTFRYGGVKKWKVFFETIQWSNLYLCLRGNRGYTVYCIVYAVYTVHNIYYALQVTRYINSSGKQMSLLVSHVRDWKLEAAPSQLTASIKEINIRRMLAAMKSHTSLSTLTLYMYYSEVTLSAVKWERIFLPKFKGHEENKLAVRVGSYTEVTQPPYLFFFWYSWPRRRSAGEIFIFPKAGSRNSRRGWNLDSYQFSPPSRL